MRGAGGRTGRVAAIVVTLLAWAQLAPAAAAPPAGAATDAPRVWAAEWMIREGDPYTDSEAAEIARRYDMVTAHPTTFRNRVAAMRSANPALTLHVYTNGAFAASYLPEYPESWYAHNAAGQRVMAVRFGTYLMNVHLKAWRDEVVRLCDSAVATSGYDGCFIDSLGNGQLASGYLDSDPVDPRTGAAWKTERWIQDTSALTTYVRSQRPNLPISINGIGNGQRYFTTATHELAAAAPLAMAESFVRSATASVGSWPGVTKWRQDVDMLVDAEANGSGILAVTKLWTSSTLAQQKQWYGLTLGTFLLGAGDRSRLFFLRNGCAPPCSNTASPLAEQWTPDAPLGAPLGAYRAAGTAFVRDFANGFVAVNPTATATNVTLPAGQFVDQDGATVSGTVSLGARRGLVLTPVPPDGGTTCDGKIATIVGTPGDDTIVGTEGDDVIQSLDGDDIVDGRGGNDLICTQFGDDVVTGGTGNDRIVDSRGVDWIDGGAGDDVVLAGPDADQVFGGDGMDVLSGGSGGDLILAGPGNDVAQGDADNDTLKGEGGTDSCNGGTGTDSAAPSCENRTATETLLSSG